MFDLTFCDGCGKAVGVHGVPTTGCRGSLCRRDTSPEAADPAPEPGCGYCGSTRDRVQTPDAWPHCPDCGGV